MRLFGKPKQDAPLSLEEGHDPEEGKNTTFQNLKADGAQTFKGIWGTLAGPTKMTWHTYTAAFNTKGRNKIGVAALALAAGYGAAQEELGAPSLGEIYATAKSGTCIVIPEGLEPAYCSTKELSAVDLAVREALTNG